MYLLSAGVKVALHVLALSYMTGLERLSKLGPFAL